MSEIGKQEAVAPKPVPKIFFLAGVLTALGLVSLAAVPFAKFADFIGPGMLNN